MFCPKCGKQNTDDAVQCVDCGTPLATPKKKKRKTGKVILIVLGVIVLLSIVGSLLGKDNNGDTQKTADLNSPSYTASNSNDAPYTARKSEETHGKIGDYIVTIADSKVVKSTYDNSNVLVVTYSFTNNSKESKAFMYAVSDTLFQNGVEIESPFTSYGFEDEYNSDNQSKEIKPGVTLEVQCAYTLADTTTDVEAEITEWVSFGNDKLTYTINLAQ